jgi:two-component system, NtrC family, response regulator AtoC
MAATVGAFQHRESESGKSKPGRRKILLIEDDTALQQYVETILDRSKFAITAFTTAAEGIENLQAARPDLILLDLFMQDTDGIEVLRQIKQVAPTVKVIALSCCHDSRYSVEALRAGARDVLLKPFHREELFQAVQTAIGPTNNDDSQHIRLDEQNMFVFASQSMRDIRHQCSLVARVDIPVLILGESGTGK